MRYNSPGKKVRLDWTKVQGPRTGDNFVVDATLLHQWCREHGTDNRFYKHYASNSYWFEDGRDAVLFKLKWT